VTYGGKTIANRTRGGRGKKDEKIPNTQDFLDLFSVSSFWGGEEGGSSRKNLGEVTPKHKSRALTRAKSKKEVKSLKKGPALAVIALNFGEGRKKRTRGNGRTEKGKIITIRVLEGEGEKNLDL